MQLSLSTIVVALTALIGTVVGESHTVHFTNGCRFGVPTLIQGPKVLATGEGYTSIGPLDSTIAYLQTGNCDFNGENCTLVELALENLADGGSGSQVDINVISPHGFSIPTGFKFYNGCDGRGAFCAGPGCQTTPVSCQVDNVNVNITFCVQ